MQLYTLYSKLLFAVIGLLFAFNTMAQDTLTIEGGDCETFIKIQKNNIYKNNKIYTGYYVKCDKNGLVKNVQQFESGKFIEYVELNEADSVLNAQLKHKKCKLRATCDPDFGKDSKDCEPITKDGIYKNGLFTGKKYIYDKNGLLDKIEIWKNGKYAGDAQID